MVPVIKELESSHHQIQSIQSTVLSKANLTQTHNIKVAWFEVHIKNIYTWTWVCILILLIAITNFKQKGSNKSYTFSTLIPIKYIVS